MSNDLEYRQSPPDFGDDDNRDDDQMFKSATLPVTDDIPLSEDDDDNPFGEVTEKPKISSNLPAATPPEQQSPVIRESQLLSADTGLHSMERDASIGSMESQPTASTVLTNDTSHLTTDLKPTKARLEGHNIEIIVSDPTKVGEVCPRLSSSSSLFSLLFFFLSPGYVIVYDLSYHDENVISYV